jgi:hypothetical protein
MAFLKSDAPPDVLETLRQLEAQANACWRGLRIRYYPNNVAIWALLTGGIRAVEREQAARTSNTPHFGPMMINISRALPIAVKWAMRYGQPAETPLNRRWSGELSAAVDEALPVAREYSHFEVCFQAFHKDVHTADVLEPALIRFTTPGAERDRQVSAWQKGLRPREGRLAGRPPEPLPQSPPVQAAFETVLRSCRATGSLGFECGEHPYLLVARNYWRWIEPRDGIAIVDHDALARALERSTGRREGPGRRVQGRRTPASVEAAAGTAVQGAGAGRLLP